MFKLLMRKQLLELAAFLYQDRQSGRRRAGWKLAGYGLFMAAMAALLLLSVGAVAVGLCDLLTDRGLDWLYFALMALAALLLGTVTGLFFAYGILYAAKDNELLLSLPLPPGQILAARMTSVWLLVGGYTALVLLPAYIAYFIYGARPLAAALAMLPFLLALSGVGLALSCAVGWVVALLSARIAKYKTLLSVLLVFGIVLFSYGCNVWMRQGLLWLIEQLDASESGIRSAAGPLWLLGLAAGGDTAALALFVLFTLALLALAYAVLRRSYLRIMTARRGAAKARYKGKAAPVRSVHAALLGRELRRLASSTAYIVNGVAGSAFLLLLAGYALLEADMLRALAPLLPVPGLAPALACAALCAAASLNFLSAPSVSLEGKTLWLLQSLPVRPWQALRAKLELHLLFTLTPLLLAAGCVLWALGCGGLPALLASLTACLYAVLAAALGLVFGLRLPNLHWTNETAVIKQSMATTLSILSCWALLVLLALLWWGLHSVAGPVGALAACAALLAAGCAALLYWLHGKGSALFAAL